MTKRLYSITRILAGALLSAASVNSCTRDIQPDGQSDCIFITLSSNASKTELDGRDVLWCPSDEISVFDGGENCRFTTTGSGKTATFTGSASLRDTFKVVYPFDYAAVIDEGDICTSLMTDQTARKGSFASGANLAATMVHSEGGTLSGTIRNVGCYFKVSVSSSVSGIKSIKAEALGGEPLSGAVRISFEEDGIPVVNDNGGNSYARLLCPEGTMDAGEYYLVMLPGELSKGLRLTVANNEGVSRSYDFKTLSRLERNVVYSFKYTVDGLIGGLEIEDLGEEIDVSSFSRDKITEWNSWKNAEDVRNLFLKAQSEHKTYFSNFKFFNYETADDILGSKLTRYGLPFVYGVDFYKAFGTYYPKSSRDKTKANLMGIVQSAWKAGHSIPSFSWHLESPYAVYEDFYKRQGQGMGCRYLYGYEVVDNFPARYRYQVRDILSNRQVDTLGIHCLGDWFDDRVREVAEFINGFVDEEGRPIPIILRLWHELEHRWAWWQVNYYKYTNCSKDDYIALFRLTVDKFRKYCPDAHILFGFCTDRSFTTESRYLTCYPGDDYVDIMGYDDYHIGRIDKYSDSPSATMDNLLLHSRVVSGAASKHGKIAAIFETNNDFTRSSDPEFSTAMNRNYYKDYVQAILLDEQTHLGFFQIWGGCDNSTAKKEALNEFIRESNIIFGFPSAQ